MNALEMQFFLLPSFLRRALWFFVRRNPYWFKDLVGTAGVTSMGMFTSGVAVGVGITPMTVTLCIGSIEKKLALVDGQAIEREVIHLNISVDHEIIDGAPLARFAERLNKILLDGRALTGCAV
jgi:pyruvate/2-oxoglutarate dehydrogenase complex dihydrolipoamide acyltransferase (E2) component